MQPGDIAGHLRDVVAAMLRREVVADGEPRAPLVVADRPHAGTPSGANGSISPSCVTR